MIQQTHTCFKCGKTIGDEEYVVNWGSCAVCLDKHFEGYLADDPFDAVSGNWDTFEELINAD